MVAHGGTSVAGSFIQTLTMVDVATGWTKPDMKVVREEIFGPVATMSTSQKPGGGLFQSLNVRIGPRAGLPSRSRHVAACRCGSGASSPIPN